jgi:hypothetical protein
MISTKIERSRMQPPVKPSELYDESGSEQDPLVFRQDESAFVLRGPHVSPHFHQDFGVCMFPAAHVLRSFQNVTKDWPAYPIKLPTARYGVIAKCLSQ